MSKEGYSEVSAKVPLACSHDAHNHLVGLMKSTVHLHHHLMDSTQV